MSPSLIHVNRNAIEGRTLNRATASNTLHQGESQSSGTRMQNHHNFATLTNQKHIQQKETKEPYKNAAPI